MIAVLTLLRASFTLPGDLVDLLHSRHGFAFVGQSAIVAKPELGRQRDEVVLTNLARSRWGIRLDLNRGYGRGITVPSANLLDAGAALENYPVAEKVDSKRFARSGGATARVDELLRGVRNAPMVHWVLSRRYVMARFDAAKELSPAAWTAFAGSIAGRYDAKARTIGIDPRAFRAQAIATLQARLVRADSEGRADTKSGLTLTAFEVMTDAELVAAYETPGTATYLAVPLGFQNARVVRYLNASLGERENVSEEMGDYIRGNMDTSIAPLIQFTPTGAIGLAVKKKDSETRIVF